MIPDGYENLEWSNILSRVLIDLLHVFKTVISSFDVAGHSQ